MNQTEQILEFDQIKDKLKEYAVTQHAKQAIMELSPSLSEVEVRARLKETTEARIMIDKCGNPPVTAMIGVDEWLEQASKGACLLPDQLEQIQIVLTSIRRLKDYLCRCKQFEIPLSYYEENLDSLDDIRDEINQKIRNGRVDDYASKQLRSIRDQIERTNEKMHEKADSVLRAHKEYMSDQFSTLRNGHICIPVKKEYKLKISGSVIDKSATGNTLFIEPDAVSRYNMELQELKIDEENEERVILYTISAMLSDKGEQFKQNMRTVEKLDFIIAKAKLSIDYNGVEPVMNTDRWISLRQGRHPLMDQHTNVPLDFEIGKKNNGIVITGPNTGGKTVAIKTVALNCYMAQCGLHVAAQKAEICMNNAILCDIGDGQNLSENLSTFSAHITNVLDILKNVTHESLVIMDELGSGTDPAEGMGIAIAILEELCKSKALFLVTTHYPEVKDYADKKEGILNAKMTFDKESLKPLYQLVIGEAGDSCAFYIAGKLGMPKSMLLRAAEAAYGTQAEKKIADIHLTEELKQNRSTGYRKIQKKKKVNTQKEARLFQLGDSVMVMPDRKIGIVCQTADDKGVLRVQMPNKKIYINHKRVKLHVAAEQLYPADYDFSIIFDSVEKRKVEHEMKRKFVDKTVEYED